MAQKFSRQPLKPEIFKKMPDKVKKIFDKFEKSGFEIWLVGGGVRSLLAGKPVVGPDFTTNATPDKIQKLLPDSFYENKFGTVGLEVDRQIFEITTYRTEGGYTDRRRPDKVKWGETLEEDLSRRDFTINSIVVSKQFLVDPFGGGKRLER